ncbi:MAG: hypothetical protein GY768_02320 [Planctomycetaceae bacterium]|nr:hypothetical protein [Planctomycetaceae bacterium]
MKDIVFALPGIAITILCWGAYGPILHKGGHGLGDDRLKPLICVGGAYFIVAIIIPVIILSSRGKLGGDWSFTGISMSMIAGTAGAIGALGIILALTSGGKPIYVMPLVFGGAPIVNVLVSMYFQGTSLKNLGARFPFFLAGVIMVAIGASMVLAFAPKGQAADKHHAPPAKSSQESTSASETKDTSAQQDQGGSHAADDSSTGSQQTDHSSDENRS